MLDPLAAQCDPQPMMARQAMINQFVSATFLNPAREASYLLHHFCLSQHLLFALLVKDRYQNRNEITANIFRTPRT